MTHQPTSGTTLKPKPEMDAAATSKSQRVRASTRQVEQLADLLGQEMPLSLTDSEGKILRANSLFCRISGYEEVELVGKTHIVMNSRVHDRSFMRHLWETISHGHIWQGEICNRTKQGRLFWTVTTILPGLGEDGLPRRYLALRHEVSHEKHAQARLRELLWDREDLNHRILATADDERRRIGVALHDDLGQILASCRMRLSLLSNDLKDHPAQAGLLELRQALDEAIARTRDLSFDLSPPVPASLGPGPAAEWLVQKAKREHGLDLELNVTPELPTLRREQHAVFFDTLRELLANIVKHAAARRSAVSLSRSNDHLLLIVQDDGKGFDVEAARKAGQRAEAFGIASLQDRVTLVGARLNIDSAPGRGTRATLTLPFAKSAHLLSNGK